MSWNLPDGISQRDIDIQEPPVVCLCDGCGHDIRLGEEYIEYKGENLCTECAVLTGAEEGDICANCGQPIDDDYYLIGKEKVCADCVEICTAEFN